MPNLALQELSERSWRGDPPAPLEALKGTGARPAQRTLPLAGLFTFALQATCKLCQSSWCPS